MTASGPSAASPLPVGPERSIDTALRRLLGRTPSRGPVSWMVELLAFGLKQAWACLFGAALLTAILAARLWYPSDARLARTGCSASAGCRSSAASCTPR